MAVLVDGGGGGVGDELKQKMFTYYWESAR
jgi:hypothetical protein